MSDEAILLPYVARGDEVVVEPHVVTSYAGIAQQNVDASNAAIT